MALAHFRVLIHELLNKDPDIFAEEAPLIILYSKSDVCIANKCRNTKHTMHTARGVHFVRNGENWKIQKIDWYEGGLQLEDIATKNVGENDLNTRMKYIMVRLDNWDGTLLQKGLQNTG